jgi:hypothetical protein
VIGHRLIVFVCEGPTCKDRWETANPRGAIAGALEQRACADSVRLEREICFGHCRQGPNLCALAADPRGTLPIRPDPEWLQMGDSQVPENVPKVIHHLTVTAAAEVIASRVAALARGSAEDLAVAANPELA